MKKLLLSLCLCICACSFQPMFSGNDTDVYVAPISGINGIELRNALNAKFGGMHEENAKYTLTVNLSSPETQYKALERTGDAKWQDIKIKADYVLKSGDKVIFKGTETASESYSFVNYLVAANASRDNAVMNSIRILSENIGMKVITITQKTVE